MKKNLAIVLLLIGLLLLKTPAWSTAARNLHTSETGKQPVQAEMQPLYSQVAEGPDRDLMMELGKEIITLRSRLDIAYKELQLLELKKTAEVQEHKLIGRLHRLYFIFTAALLLLLLGAWTFNRFRSRNGRNALEEERKAHLATMEKLKECDDKFTALSQRSVVGVYIIHHGILKYVNPRFCRILGYTVEEMMNLDPLGMIFPDDRPNVAENLRRRLSGEVESVHYQFRGLRKDGEVVYLESFGSRTVYQGEPAVVGIMIDVTERRKAELELRRGRKMETVGILSEDIAHHFNQSLAVIMNNISAIKELEHHDKHILPRFKKIEAAAVEAAGLAGQFINFSRGGWNLAQETRAPYILQNAVKRFPEIKPYIQNVNFDYYLNPIKGDERQLGKMMYHLIKNAAQSGSDPAKIIIAGYMVLMDQGNTEQLETGMYLKLSVSDKGEGIPAELVGRIFDPYFTTKHEKTSNGFGLGLTICQVVVNKHRGKIEVASTPGSGTVVDVYLPAF